MDLLKVKKLNTLSKKYGKSIYIKGWYDEDRNFRKQNKKIWIYPCKRL